MCTYVFKTTAIAGCQWLMPIQIVPGDPILKIPIIKKGLVEWLKMCVGGKPQLWCKARIVLVAAKFPVLALYSKLQENQDVGAFVASLRWVPIILTLEVECPVHSYTHKLQLSISFSWIACSGGSQSPCLFLFSLMKRPMWRETKIYQNIVPNCQPCECTAFTDPATLIIYWVDCTPDQHLIVRASSDTKALCYGNL
jgi:hypothetical protein